MGRFAGLAATLTLLVGVLEAEIVCEAEDGMCEGSIEALLTEGSSKNETSDLDCAATATVPFCWWAIEIGQLKWQLYTNGMSPLIERNIGPFCEKVDEFHGFSFTNRTTIAAYTYPGITTNELSRERQVLADVFYFCCSRKANCSVFSENASENEIINTLANKMQSYIIMASGFSEKSKKLCFGDDGTKMVALPGVDVCIFMADSDTEVKIYNGPMMFNRFDVLSEKEKNKQQRLAALAYSGRLCLSTKPADNNNGTHLGDGECLRHSSSSRYLLFCCCYVRRELCAYAIDEYHWKKSVYNRRIWRRNAQLRAIHGVNTKDGKLVAGQSSAYRDFIFSKPTNRRNRRTAGENHISLWHCAVEERVLKVNDVKSEPVHFEKVNRSDLPPRSSACYTNVIVDFTKNGYARKVEKISLIYGHSEEMCGTMTCHMSEPECVDDLLDMERDRIRATMHCCCGTHNLCNRGNGNQNHMFQTLGNTGGLDGSCVGGIYKHVLNTLTGERPPDYVYCIHYIDFREMRERYLIEGETYYIPVAKGKMFAEQYFHYSDQVVVKTLMLLPLPRPGCGEFHHQQIMQFAVAFCASTVDTLSDGIFCDVNYFSKIPELIKKAQRPECESGIHVLDAGNVHSHTNISTTMDMPLCIDEIYVLNKNELVWLESGVFNPAAHKQKLRFKEPSFIFDTDYGPSSFHMAHICVSRLQKPCNGLLNIMRNLMPRMMTYVARWKIEEFGEYRAVVQRSSRLQSSCRTSDGEIKCTTAMGCFVYRSFDGRKPLLGCIEDISRFHSENPELRDVLDCRSMLWSDDANICNAVVDASRFNGTAGVLCCCRNKCPAPVNTNPTSNAVGFQPFNTVL